MLWLMQWLPSRLVDTSASPHARCAWTRILTLRRCASSKVGTCPQNILLQKERNIRVATPSVYGHNAFKEQRSQNTFIVVHPPPLPFEPHPTDIKRNFPHLRPLIFLGNFWHVFTKKILRNCVSNTFQPSRKTPPASTRICATMGSAVNILDLSPPGRHDTTRVGA